MKLKDMHIGRQARVQGYAHGCDRRYRLKLIQIGLCRGATFTLARKAPMGDPVELRLRDCSVTLRQAEADAMEIEALET